MLYSASLKNTLIGRLEHGSDLLEELNKICDKERITLGRISGIGAVQKACFSYYNQEKHAYQYIVLEKKLEILSLSGNISMKDGKPFVHAHIVLGDENGLTYGGHLSQQTLVFACEVIIDILQGPSLNRVLDNTTQLSLWPKEIG
ncbi:MAG: DNA-binding protein [Candidatus Brocadiae bacterium]|nr:DNA-binding protein [Candidatus Brocadiia bacterium]